ncbi:MAG: DUF3084 domain-containing protein [Firmicutes bacterium]|nr:DUF3084 domain-containing protein [Bacillota bacterium]
MYGFGLVFMLVVIGGIIAFIGDRIGMKIGKRRLSIFGLRPKHTSILITVITGIIVAATSVLVMSIVSQDVRTALFKMHEIQTTLASTQDTLASTQGQLSAAFSELVVKEDELRKGEERVTELQEKINGLTSEIDGLSTELMKVRKEHLTAKHDKERLEEESRALETLIGDLTKEANELYEFIGLMREFLEGLQLSDITYRAEEIILAVVMDGNAQPEDIRDEISGFLRQGNKLALGRKANIEGSEEEAIIFFMDNLETIAEKVAQAEGPVVIRLVSATNAFVGQPVYAYLQIFENTLLFESGQTVAERIIDGSMGQDIVQDELMNLLMAANDEATHLGMVTDKEGRVGQVSYSQFDTAKSQIINSGKKVRVLAIALQDTWNTKPPLKIGFKVESLKD